MRSSLFPANSLAFSLIVTRWRRICRSRHKWGLSIAMSTWLICAHAPADAAVYLCNGSATTRVSVSVAWQAGYAGNYVVTGWHQLQPAPNRLFSQCVQLGYDFLSPVYVAIAHADASGRMALYHYDIDTWGGTYAPTNRWICVSLSKGFHLNGSRVEDLYNCPQELIAVPFGIQINPPNSDDDTRLYVAEAGSVGYKLATFDEISQGTAASVALHPETGSYGDAAGYVNFELSNKDALAACELAAQRSGCKIVSTTRGGCMAIARSATRKVSVSIDRSQSAARQTALDHCNRSHGNCSTVRSFCTK